MAVAGRGLVDPHEPSHQHAPYLVRAGERIAIPEGSPLRAELREVARSHHWDLAAADLSPFNAIVTGTRAYGVRDDLRTYNQRLLDYVKTGGNLIVLYNTPGEFDPVTLADRVVADLAACGSVFVGRSEIGAWSTKPT